MSLAVFDKKPWICTAYYYIDYEFALYILTGQETEHGQIIEKNNTVACNIFDSKQKITDKKVGAQVEGTAEMLGMGEKLKWAIRMWNDNSPGISDIINFKNYERESNNRKNLQDNSKANQVF